VNTELTVVMDLFDRRITGLRLRPIAAQSPDVASAVPVKRPPSSRCDTCTRRQQLAGSQNHRRRT
jgi:hypothetical protein